MVTNVFEMNFHQLNTSLLPKIFSSQEKETSLSKKTLFRLLLDLMALLTVQLKRLCQQWIEQYMPFFFCDINTFPILNYYF